MRRIACQPKARIAALVSELTGCPPFTEHYTAVGLFEGADVVAGMVFTDYVPEKRIQMHVAARPAKHWATRDLLRAAFDYPFLQLKVKVVISPVRRSNKRCHIFARHVGGRCTGVIPRGFGDEDMLIYTMTREQCRWI